MVPAAPNTLHMRDLWCRGHASWLNSMTSNGNNGIRLRGVYLLIENTTAHKETKNAWHNAMCAHSALYSLRMPYRRGAEVACGPSPPAAEAALDSPESVTVVAIREFQEAKDAKTEPKSKRCLLQRHINNKVEPLCTGHPPPVCIQHTVLGTKIEGFTIRCREVTEIYLFVTLSLSLSRSPSRHIHTYIYVYACIHVKTRNNSSFACWVVDTQYEHLHNTVHTHTHTHLVQVSSDLTWLPGVVTLPRFWASCNPSHSVIQ